MIDMTKKKHSRKTVNDCEKIFILEKQSVQGKMNEEHIVCNGFSKTKMPADSFSEKINFALCVH